MRRKERLWIYVDLPEPSVNVHCVVKSLGYIHARKKGLAIHQQHEYEEINLNCI